MSWFGDVGNFFKNTWENITPWEEEREKKRKQTERAKQPSQPNATPKPAPVIGQNNQFGQNNQQKNPLSPFEPKQNNILNPAFKGNNTAITDLTTQLNGQTVIKAPKPDKSITDKIPGYMVMSPEAQKKAVVNSPQAKMERMKQKINKQKEDAKKRENTAATAMGALSSAGKAVQETPKAFANLPGLFIQGFDWVGDASSRAGQSLNQWVRDTDEETKKKERAALDEKLNNDMFSNWARNWYKGVDDLSEKTGLQKYIDDSDDSIQSNIETLVKNQGDMTTAQKLLFTAGEVGGNVVDPLTFLPAAKAITLASKAGKGAKALDAVEDVVKTTSDTDKAMDAIQAARKSHVDLQKAGADKSTLEKSAKNIQDLENNSKLTNTPDANKKVTWVNRETGEKGFYTPKSNEEYLDLVKKIDGSDNGVAGITDKNGNVFHITAGGLDDGYKKIDGDFGDKFAPDAKAVQGAKQLEKQADEAQGLTATQKAQQAEQNSVKQGGGLNYDEMVERLQQRRETGQPAQGTRAASVQKEAPIDYSDAALEQRLSSTGLSQQEVNNLTTQYGMSKMDWQILLNRVGDLSTADRKPAVIASELKKMRGEGVHGQTRQAMNNNVTAQRLAKEAEEATPVTQTEGGAIIDTPEGRVDTRTGEILDDVPPQSLSEDIAGELSEVVAKYVEEVKEIGESLKKLGFDPAELRQKMTLANRGEYKMTPDELAAESLMTNRFDVARGKLAESGLEFDGKQMHYTPQVRQGEASLPTSREELTNFGYANKRTNSMDVDDLDYGDNPMVDYLVKAENRSLVVQESMAKSAEVDGRMLTREGVQQAADDTIVLQKKIADAKGSEKVVKNDTVSDLNQIGKNEGYAQELNKVKAGKVSQEPREMLTRAGVYDNGFQQYDNAVGYASEFTRQVVDNNIPSEQLAEALSQSIRKAMPKLEQSSIDEAVAGAVRRIESRQLKGQDIAPQVLSAYRSAAKADMFQLGKSTQFADKKMQAVVNEQMNARLLQDNYGKNFAQELDSFIAQRINASLRGGNVVSAAFELGDLANIAAHYGLKDLKNSKFGFGKIDGDMRGMSKRYGEADSHFLSSDIPQVSKLDEIWSNDDTSFIKKIGESYKTGENKLLVFRYVEEYKTELFFRQADAHYRAKGLEGTELVNAVQQDYLNVMLPNKIITANRLLGKLPKSLTQYLNWSVQATKRLGRTVSGNQTGGLYDGMSRGSKVARGVGVELAPKVATAALLGVPIQQILGMRDWTGATDGDFSGIPEEERNLLDSVMGYVGMSPALGVVSNLYYAGRRNDIAETDDDDRTEANPNWIAESLGSEATKLVPFYTQIKKSLGVQDAVNEGYFENQDGRVQFDAPDAGSLSHLLGLITGKTYMRENRDYGDNPDLLSVLQGKAGLGDLLTHNQTIDNLMQTLGFDTARDYERPVSNNDFIAGRDENGDLVEFNYNDWVKQQYESGSEKGEATLAQAKEYNEALDNLRYQNPDVYEAYLDIMDDKDLVSPERWSALTGTNSEDGFDLTLVKMMGDRKKSVAQAAADSLGKPEYANNYDPMYNLDDDQLRSVLQQKSTATGDDIALRNVLYKDEWYQEYMAESRQYYDQQLFGDEDFGNTERVKEWNDQNTSLSQLSYMQPSKYDSEEVSEQKAALREQFPYNSAYQAAKSKYEEKTGKDYYGSEESKQWYAQYGDGKKAEDGQLDAAKLEVINQMRGIEGHPPMSEEEYAQATEIANTSGGGGSSGSGGGGKKGAYDSSFLPSWSNSFTWSNLAENSIPSKVRAFKPNTKVGRRTNSKKRLGASSRGGDTYRV